MKFKTILFLTAILGSTSGFGFDLQWLRDSDDFGSIYCSRISYLDLNYGLVFSQIINPEGPGFELSINPGISSTNFQMGIGKYTHGGPCGIPSGYSADLLIGRTYFLNSMFKKDETYYGIQLKAGLLIIGRIGLLYSSRDNFGFNLGLGFGI